MKEKNNNNKVNIQQTHTNMKYFTKNLGQFVNTQQFSGKT